MSAILNRDPSEPAIVIGHSWGGAAALRLADSLHDVVTDPPSAYYGSENGNINLLLTIDPERFGRTGTPATVPDNVESAVNIAPKDGWPHKTLGMPFLSGPDSLINAQNGTNKIQGALNIDIEWVQSVRMDHYTIVDINAHRDLSPTVNPRTRILSVSSVYGVLNTGN